MEGEVLMADLDRNPGMDDREVEAHLTAEGLPLVDPLSFPAEEDPLLGTALKEEEEEVTACRTVEDLPCLAPMEILGSMNGSPIAN
jgi:hypothetical protein